jgi:hypothetical protein
MKAEMITDRKTGTNANVEIDTNAFIRQTAGISSYESMPQPIETVNQAETAYPKTQQEIIESSPEPPIEKPAKRKRGQAVDYESVFLCRNELRDRQGLYIDRDNYETLQTLVRCIRSERLSVSGLVDNIVRYHIEVYEDEINRIYEDNIRKPIKRKQ